MWRVIAKLLRIIDSLALMSIWRFCFWLFNLLSMQEFNFSEQFRKSICTFVFCFSGVFRGHRNGTLGLNGAMIINMKWIVAKVKVDSDSHNWNSFLSVFFMFSQSNWRNWRARSRSCCCRRCVIRRSRKYSVEVSGRYFRKLGSFSHGKSSWTPEWFRNLFQSMLLLI